MGTNVVIGSALTETDWYIWLALIALGAIRWAIHKSRESRAQSFPVTQGTVEWTWVRSEGAQDDHQVSEVCYSYSINGEFFSGTYPNAEKNFDLFPKGSRILIHYNPDNPSKSFVDREEIRMRMSGQKTGAGL